MLLIMAVTFYMSRVVLDVLGPVDFGIYDVVGGLVTMFSIFSGSFSFAISRFLAIELGRNNRQRVNLVFSTAINIQLFISFIILALVELIGVWFLNNKMNIPVDRLLASNWVLQCSIFSFVVNLLSLPYNALIIAHERMRAFAYISLIEVFLKLGITYFLYLRLSDGLIVYSILLFFVTICVRVVYSLYCKKYFPECKYNWMCDKKVLKEMAAFAGWNFIGVTSGVLRDQGVNILLNLFCGTIINAARSISMQVYMGVNSLVNNFLTALNPQILKSYASGDKKYMMQLIFNGARFSYYLLLLISLPLIIETDVILSFWLRAVPPHTMIFVRLILVFALSESLSLPLITGMFATGKIRNYQLIVGGIQMLNFPLSYLLLYLGVEPEGTVCIAIFLSQVCLFMRLYMLRSMIGLSVKAYMEKVYLNILPVSILSMIFPFVLYRLLDETFFRFLLVSVSCLICTSLTVYFVGCSYEEKTFVQRKMKELRQKYSKT